MNDIIVKIGENEYTPLTDQENKELYYLNENEYNIRLLKRIAPDVYSFSINNKVIQVEFEKDWNGSGRIIIEGLAFDYKTTDETKELLKKFIKDAAAAASDGVTEVLSPMPGLVVKILAEEEQQIKKGEPVAIVEAMKMENALKAPENGIVRNIKTSAGEAVEKGYLLLEIHAE